MKTEQSLAPNDILRLAEEVFYGLPLPREWEIELVSRLGYDTGRVVSGEEDSSDSNE